MRLESRCRVLNAESVYRALRDMDLSGRELQRLTAEFYADDHRFWEQEQKPPHPNMARNRKEDWDQKREKMRVEMEAFSEEMSEDEKDLAQPAGGGKPGAVRLQEIPAEVCGP